VGIPPNPMRSGEHLSSCVKLASAAAKSSKWRKPAPKPPIEVSEHLLEQPPTVLASRQNEVTVPVAFKDEECLARHSISGQPWSLAQREDFKAQ